LAQFLGSQVERRTLEQLLLVLADLFQAFRLADRR